MYTQQATVIQMRAKNAPPAQTLASTHPQDAYRRQDILTANSTELIVMLYDALKKNIVLGRRAIQSNNNEKAHNGLIKAQTIVTELITSLDMNYPISEEMLAIYEFMNRTLGEANVSKNADNLEPLLEIVDSLREAWQEVSRQNKGSLHQSGELLEEETNLSVSVE